MVVGVRSILIYQSGSSGVHVNSGGAVNHCKIITNSRLEVRLPCWCVCVREKELFFCFETKGNVAKNVFSLCFLN